MPPEGYTTITISEETAGKLAEMIVENDLEGVADYAADVARDSETPSDAELARLLYRRLAD